MAGQTFLTIQEPVANQPRFVFNQERGLRQLLGTLPCPYARDQPHPISSVDGRKFARFRRRIEGGTRYQARRGRKISFVTLAMKYGVENGELAVEGRDALRKSIQRFIQMLRRRFYKGLCEGLPKWKVQQHRTAFLERASRSIEYLDVKECTDAGVTNHGHLVIASYGDLPSEHEMKDMWATATYGTSYEVKSVPASTLDVGWLTRYLSKALGSYLSKSMGDPEAEGRGLDRSCQNATDSGRISDHVSTSRGWLPHGAQKEWSRLFKECAFIWTCDRGFFHTNMGSTGARWLEWLDRQVELSI